MVKKAGELSVEVKENMRGGKGGIKITHIFKKDEMKGKSRLCAKFTIDPGASIGLHEHVEEEEIYYIIRGSGVVIDSGVRYEISVGDAILTGGGASHSIENTGSEPLELVALILLY